MVITHHLRQRRLGLTRTSFHRLIHRVAVDSAVRACPLSCLGIQYTEAPVAVRLERAHAQRAGQD
jgi:hypothetical protein